MDVDGTISTCAFDLPCTKLPNLAFIPATVSVNVTLDTVHFTVGGIARLMDVAVVPRLVAPLNVSHVITHVPEVADGNCEARETGGVQLYDVPTPVAIVPVAAP